MFLFVNLEPKSGTTTASAWAWRGLSGTCTYLQGLYGQSSCCTEISEDGMHKVIFEPEADETAPCVCDGVKR